MSKFKIINLVFLLFISFSSILVLANAINFTNAPGKGKMGVVCLNLSNPSNISLVSSWSYINNNNLNPGDNFNCSTGTPIIFVYPKSENYAWKSFSGNNNSVYIGPYGSTLLTSVSNKCEPRQLGIFLKGKINSTFFNVINWLESKTGDNDILRNNYYMQAFAFLKLIKEDGRGPDEIFVLPEPSYNYSYVNPNSSSPLYGTMRKNLNSTLFRSSYSGQEIRDHFFDPLNDIDWNWWTDLVYFNGSFYNSESWNRLPLIYLTPDDEDLSKIFNKTKIRNKLEYFDLKAKYKAELTVIPVDMKCDMDKNGTIDSSEMNYIRDIHISALDFNVGDISKAEFRKDSSSGYFKFNIKDRKKDLVQYDKGSKKLKYIKSPSLPPITLPMNLSKYNDTIEIVTYKNGLNIYNQTVTVDYIAMSLTPIERFKDVDDIEKEINRSYNLFKKYNITRKINYDAVLDKTTITYDLNTTAGTVSNLTIYEIFPKEVISDAYKNITPLSNIDNYFILDRDPVIGWFFNSSGNTSVSYSVNGSSSAGVLIITQSPIIYNDGKLIFSYRDNGSCNSNEIHLFDIKNLSDSKIYQKGTSDYQVCVSHLTEILSPDSTYSNNIEIGSYEMSNNFSTNYIQFSKKIEISTPNNSVYWNYVISETNPDGNFSCLGSVDIVNDSTVFGDCSAFSKNRLWLKLDADLNPPKTTLDFPYLAHKMEVFIEANDGYGSGVKNLSYRIDGGPWNVTTTSNLVSFYLTCDNDWGCTKKIEYTSCDNAGNCDILHSYDLKIIDKGTACQSDCSARPSPNRYLKECRNLNGCKYYPYDKDGVFDDGEYVANQCNLFTVGSYVKYNDTHNIKCPNGPIVASKYSNTVLDIFKSKCDYIFKIPYPVILDGDSMIMDIIYCFDYEDLQFLNS